ncbi:hypothetical protein BDW42DRAFT_199668 [Aspergillus taichungensis]|uniref:Xylanolytic transcriptional activator regulatory domain-containing protein n=1 Tax=Aspergillus taichungensis TaxID=482145 RepID=A0A2J5HDU4_9EURO|nr:hypothetical protein BDW42DRAFT_199668 [Aspergillus taichungensis]
MAPPPPTDPMLEDEFSFDWLNGYDPAAPVGAPHESALDGSSPSAMSTGSQSGISEALLDGTGRFPMPAASWHNPFPTGHHGLPAGPGAPLDFGVGGGGPAPDPLNGGGPPPETVSPKSLMAQTHNPFAETYATPPSMTAVGPPLLGGHHAQSMFPSSMAPRGDSPNPRTLAVAHSALRAPHRSAPDTVTDATRQALLAGLAPPPPAAGAGSDDDDDDPRLPRTADLHRYLTAYLTECHPHLPFLHLPTLDFQAPEYTPRAGAAPGGGLLVAMAALGARFAGDAGAAQALFAVAQTMIHRALEEFRPVVAPPPPLWLVQALLLTILYSHTGDDPAAADRARPHCATLVRLARALERPGAAAAAAAAADDRPPDPSLAAAAPGSDPPAARRAWLAWIAEEARTRTRSAVFVLSAFLVAAYHQAPALTNSEFRLDLPCEEALWAAESPQAWAQRGGAVAAARPADRVSFATALTTLLTASQRGPAAPDDLRPSTFGCLVLIYALHNYIWETRHRHRGRPWTARETDAMQAHLEPALRAWQTAWARHPAHSLEYPNPFGAGPLSADSIPLLDLAYVRLYVDLGRRRAAFWAHDDETPFVALSSDAAGGADVVAPDALPTAVLDPSMRPADAGAGGRGLSPSPSPRERHLRRAAFYAADSITMSQRLGTTFAASPCRDLPIQSALCAFDCAQVLAEWLATVEGRALTPEPGLEEEDRTLVATIGTILARIEAQGLGSPRVAGGYGPQILAATAGFLERTGGWPVTKLMARSLEAQARRLPGRPLLS